MKVHDWGTPVQMEHVAPGACVCFQGEDGRLRVALVTSWGDNPRRVVLIWPDKPTIMSIGISERIFAITDATIVPDPSSLRTGMFATGTAGALCKSETSTWVFATTDPLGDLHAVDVITGEVSPKLGEHRVVFGQWRIILSGTADQHVLCTIQAPSPR